MSLRCKLGIHDFEYLYKTLDIPKDSWEYILFGDKVLTGEEECKRCGKISDVSFSHGEEDMSF